MVMKNGRISYRYKDEFRLLRDAHMSDHIWRKLIKDFNMPVSYINLSSMCDILERTINGNINQGSFEVFKWAVQLCILPPDQQEAFMGLTRDVMDAMIQHVLDSEGYKEGFNKVDIQQLMPLENLNIPSGDIYTHQNIGKKYLSLDLSSAAFQAFHYWDINFGDYGCILPKNADTYNYWVSHTVARLNVDDMSEAKRAIRYNKDLCQAIVDYVCDSKQLRQVIFGKTNPKRIQHVEKYMVQQMVKTIKNKMNLLPVRLNNDEILYEITNEWTLQMILDIRNIVLMDLYINWHVTRFELDAYQMIQRINYIDEQLINNGPLVFVKADREELDDNFIWVDKSASFKCLPTRFAFAFEQMYKEILGIADKSTFGDSEYFLGLPVMVDGFASWVVGPDTTWEIKKMTFGSETYSICAVLCVLKGDLT